MAELSKRQIKAAKLEATGMLAREIAKDCGITPQTISAYRNLDEYQVLISRLSQSALRASQLMLLDASCKAVSTILEAMDSDNDSVRLKAAECVLTRLGMVDVQHWVGPTSVAEKKAGEIYQSPDMAYFKDQFKEVDDIIQQLGL